MGRRIRTIKPEVLDDIVLASLEHDAWRAYFSMKCIADDYGRFAAHPAQLGATLFWARAARSMIEIMVELAKAGLVTFFRVRGGLYGQICGWDDIERVDHPGKPHVPAPDDEQASVIAPTPADLANAAQPLRETLSRDGKGKEGKGREGIRGAGDLANNGPTHTLPLLASVEGPVNGAAHALAEAPAPKPVVRSRRDRAQEASALFCEWFNRKFDRQFRTSAEMIRQVAVLVVDRRFDLTDLKRVALYLRALWIDDAKMRAFLVPSTILRTEKFAERHDLAREWWARQNPSQPAGASATPEEKRHA